MDKIVTNYQRINEIENEILKLSKALRAAESIRKQMINSCKHDLILVYKQVNDTLAGDIYFGHCLLCNNTVSFNYQYYLYDYKEGLLEQSISPNNVIDITNIISKGIRERWELATNLCAKRARDKFVNLMKLEYDMSLEQIKDSIINDLKLYEQELLSNVKLYTLEEVRKSIEPDDNTEIINAICEECSDLCSENAKRKIK